MKIESIRVFTAAMPRTDPQWRTASYAASGVNGLFLEVHADGVSGIGATIARPNGVPVAELEAQLSGKGRELLVGKDAFERAAILSSLQAADLHRSIPADAL